MQEKLAFAICKWKILRKLLISNDMRCILHSYIFLCIKGGKLLKNNSMLVPKSTFSLFSYLINIKRIQPAWCSNQKFCQLCLFIQLYPFIRELRVMIFCYKNCSDLLWEKIVLVIEKIIFLKAENLQTFWDHLNNLFKQWKVRTISGNRMLF